jgi:hypothetical protein
MATTTKEGQENAKDFIWNHLPEKTREYMVLLAEMPAEERVKLYSKGINCFLQADRHGEVIGQEIAYLSFPQ